MPLQFDDINEIIIDDIKEALRLQGHHLTGALERSLTPDTTKEANGYSISAEALAYIKDLEEGVRPEHIAVDAAAIREMTRYVELRMGYTGKYAIKVAIAILNKQRKEGMPTQNSYQYSQTGERLDAVYDTFKENGATYNTMIDDEVVGELDNQFHTIKSGSV
ncbi:MAG: hypothetical protein ACTHMM_16660 [Agriterribacter sp.]